MAQTYVLKRDDTRCVACGNCNSIIPGLPKHLTQYGSLFVSAAKLQHTEADIHKAIENCYLDALTMERVDET